MDFAPGDYRPHAVFLQQRVSDDPSFEATNATLQYDAGAGRLGANLHVSVSGSDDDTDNSVLVREEIRIDVPLPSGWTGGDVRVDARFTTVGTDQQFIKIDDEAGFSDLMIAWASTPYVRVAVPDAERVYGDVLAYGFSTWNMTGTGTPTVPTPTEERSIVLEAVKAAGQLPLAVGLEHSVSGHSNDYSYEVRSIGDFTLDRVSVPIG
jgi:hypothetical protein